MSSAPPRLGELIDELQRHGVSFVVIGSVAAAVHGVELEPGDLDIAPAMDAVNRKRLARALVALDARPVNPPGHWETDAAGERRWLPDADAPQTDWQPQPGDAASFDHAFATRLGQLDVVPDLAGSFEELVARATKAQVGGRETLVASRDDVLAGMTRPRRDKDADRVRQLRAAGPMEAGRRESWLMDMDGVIVREDELVPGADRFIERLHQAERRFLILTNNSMYTARDLGARLARMGLQVSTSEIWTSALATAKFLADQRPGGTAFAIGEAGLTTALYEAGYTLSETDPDYVVLGETRTYSFERIARAIQLIVRGARFIATNPDPTGPTPTGPLPATGSVAALISTATGVQPYFIGKPNPLMIRSALRAIGAHSESTVMVGDRMDTDIVTGIEAGLETILVLTGITTRDEAGRFSYLPSHIVDSVADLVDWVEPPGA